VKFKYIYSALVAILGISLAFASAPLVQAQSNTQTATCDQTYTVVAGDTLGSIAQKLLGDIKAYTQIADATNNAAKTDSSFATIPDPNKIEVGWKLCIPAKTNVTPPPSEQGPGPVVVSPTPSVAPLSLSALGNATYNVQDAPGGTVTLKEGKAEVAQASGGASNFTAQISDPVANGTLDGKAYAAADLITSGGGSGVFDNLAVVPNNNGTAGTGMTTLLGDRIKVQSITFTNNVIQVVYLDRKPDEPMSNPPTVPVTKNYTVSSAGAIVEAAAPAATATPPPGSMEGTYISSGPAADASALLQQLLLAPNNNAAMTLLYVGKATSEMTGTWNQTTANTATVNFIHQDGQNIGVNLTFQLNGDTLTATQFDKGTFGDAGLTMYRATGVISGTVTYTQKIALPDDAVVEVYLTDPSKAGTSGEYISGISYTAHGQQVPLQFDIPYASSQINPSGQYLLQAFISSNGQLLFKNSSGPAVITNGAPTSNVEIVVQQP